MGPKGIMGVIGVVGPKVRMHKQTLYYFSILCITPLITRVMSRPLPQGWMGEPGYPGKQGRPGDPGDKGAKGENGTLGDDGMKGDNGFPGKIECTYVFLCRDGADTCPIT